VEAVGEGPEVLASVLAEVEGLIAAADHRLEVAQHGVDLCELPQFTGLSPTYDDVRVRAIGIDDAGKAPQAIAAHVTPRGQVLPRPLRNSFALEGRQRTELDSQRTAVIAQGHRSHDGHLVRRAAATDAS